MHCAVKVITQLTAALCFRCNCM